MNLFPTALVVEQLHVETLITVLLGCIDIVGHTAWTLLEIVRKHGIDIQAQFLLLLQVLRVIDDADIVFAIHMVEVTSLGTHLAPYAIGHTVAKLYPCFDAIVFQQLAHLCNESFEVLLLCQFHFIQHPFYLFILTRTAVMERQVFQLSLHMIQSKTVGKRSVEIVRLAGNLHLLVRTHTCQCAHIVQAVGKLHQNGTHVILYRCQYLTVVVHLLRLIILLLFLLCHHTYEEGHVLPETLADVLNGVLGIFHHVMQECRHHGIGTKFQFLSYNTCHGNRMNDIRLTRLAFLLLVCLGSQFVCVADKLHLLVIHSLSQHLEDALNTSLHRVTVNSLHIFTLSC